jgi:hypothetical protein
MDTNEQELLSQATVLANNLKSLADGYKELVLSAPEPGPDGKTARRSLDRKFRKLPSRQTIDQLRERGFTEAADRLQDIWSATAWVFNLVAVSIGVDESEVLEIDTDGPYAAALDALSRGLKG